MPYFAKRAARAALFRKQARYGLFLGVGTGFSSEKAVPTGFERVLENPLKGVLAHALFCPPPLAAAAAPIFPMFRNEPVET